MRFEVDYLFVESLWGFEPLLPDEVKYRALLSQMIVSSKWDPKAEIDISTLPYLNEIDFLKINKQNTDDFESDEQVCVKTCFENRVGGPLRFLR